MQVPELVCMFLIVFFYMFFTYELPAKEVSLCRDVAAG